MHNFSIKLDKPLFIIIVSKSPHTASYLYILLLILGSFQFIQPISICQTPQIKPLEWIKEGVDNTYKRLVLIKNLLVYYFFRAKFLFAILNQQRREI
jgi:hypothetical protein